MGSQAVRQSPRSDIGSGSADPGTGGSSTTPVWEVLWEVLLAGAFEPYGATEQVVLEAAYQRGEPHALVRGGKRLVTLRPPLVQRAAPDELPCKQRDVRRRVACPRLSLAPAAAVAAARTRPLAAGARVRLRWVAGEPWQYAEVTGTQSFADAAGVVQHGLRINGSVEWVDLTETAAYEVL
jgi:hypothetical protein